MVKAIEILNKLLEKQDFRDQKDVDCLLGLCKEYPDFKLPFLLLLNYQPDFFNADFWKKGDEFALNSKELFDVYFKKKTINRPKKNLTFKALFETATDKCNIQKEIIKTYLNKPLKRFI